MHIAKYIYIILINIDRTCWEDEMQSELAKDVMTVARNLALVCC